MIDTFLVEFVHAAAIANEVLVRLPYCVELRDERKIANLRGEVSLLIPLFSAPFPRSYTSCESLCDADSSTYPCRIINFTNRHSNCAVSWQFPWLSTMQVEGS